mmetsp:Transcript_6514/g.20515  ORF Transcript_6514/g.20515 Transcript_6514/m.20515 type:complete len:325 (+) Transcript_6514:100-1074(+)
MHRGFERKGTDVGASAEGNVAGARAARLTKEREADQKKYDEAKKKIESDAVKALPGRIDDKFDKTVLNTVLSGGGLQTAAEYKASQARPAAAAPVAEAPKPKTDARAAKRAKITQRAMLSFGDEFEEEEGAAPPPKKGLKCPDAVTDFLPDARRDAEAEAKRQELTAEYRALQAKAKLEPLRVVYSYWDGSAHRRVLDVHRGDTIAAFLEKARDQLSGEFPALRSVAVENLIYVKEDLILPGHVSFHELIVAKARGKSGPLFDFGVRDDVRAGPTDVRAESDAVHPGKVLLRAWYERNRSLFPASRWEVYEVGKTYGARYTVKG